MKKNSVEELKFSTLKIKRIIQENKEIGKIANMTPYVISKSLEYLLSDLLNQAADKASDENSNKVYGYHIKNIINKNENLSFLKETVEDIPDEKVKKKSRKNK